MKKFLKTLLVFCGILLIVSGCGKIPVAKNGEEDVLKLKDTDVTVTTLYEALKDKYGVEVMVNLIDKMVLEKEYPTDEDETTYIDQQVKSAKDYAKENNASLSSLLEYNFGISTETEYRDLLSLSYKRNLAIEDYVESTIKDKEVNNYYKNSIKGDINAKHILVAPETADGMTAEEEKAAKAAALKTAKAIIKKLKDGEDWDKLAKEYSDDDSNADKGGDLGWFNTGKMEESFEKAAYALKKGKYTTTPIETSYGYHIIYLVDTKEKPKLEDVKEEIISTLINNKLEENTKLQYTALEKLRQDAGLEIYDDELNKAYKSYLKSLQ